MNDRDFYEPELFLLRELNWHISTLAHYRIDLDQPSFLMHVNATNAAMIALLRQQN
jgi:hypothetical protein